MGILGGIRSFPLSYKIKHFKIIDNTLLSSKNDTYFLYLNSKDLLIIETKVYVGSSGKK